MSGYWGYYQSGPPKEVKDGIKAKSRRGAIGERWWSRRWVDLIESQGLEARMKRGRSYARRGQVVSIDVQKGVVRSKVQGVGSKPYDVEIRVAPIAEDDWEEATKTMASKAVFAAKLLNKEMPTEIEEAFEEVDVSLFPTIRDLETSCSCPDRANPCKHIAAVYYLLAEKFDENPFLMFELRGRTKEEVVGELRRVRASATENRTHQDLDRSEKDDLPPRGSTENFWHIGQGLEDLALVPVPPKVPYAVLRRIGDAPCSIGDTNLASCLPEAYDVAGRAALEKGKEEKLDFLLPPDL